MEKHHRQGECSLRAQCPERKLRQLQLRVWFPGHVSEHHGIWQLRLRLSGPLGQLRQAPELCLRLPVAVRRGGCLQLQLRLPGPLRRGARRHQQQRLWQPSHGEHQHQCYGLQQHGHGLEGPARSHRRLRQCGRWLQCAGCGHHRGHQRGRRLQRPGRRQQARPQCGVRPRNPEQGGLLHQQLRLRIPGPGRPFRQHVGRLQRCLWGQRPHGKLRNQQRSLRLHGHVEQPRGWHECGHGQLRPGCQHHRTRQHRPGFLRRRQPDHRQLQHRHRQRLRCRRRGGQHPAPRQGLQHGHHARLGPEPHVHRRHPGREQPHGHADSRH